jgi:hypothetical protein
MSKFQDMKISMEKVFDSHDWASFHDAMYNSTGISMTQAELTDVWTKLPTGIKCTGFEWGMGDTEFRDSVYLWAEKNWGKDGF